MVSTTSWLEPPLPGVLPGSERPHLILAQYIDYPPYAYLEDTTLELTGFGPAFAKGMAEMCDVDVTIVQTEWSNCWTSGIIGIGLLDGWYHGCMTYTHTIGERPRQLEFSHAILDENKPVGIITRLDAAGNPIVSPSSDLEGVTVIDVVGWAPTKDGLQLTRNPCTGNHFSGFTIVEPSMSTADANDDALRALLHGEGDALYIYSDQAAEYQCGPGALEPWDCDLWAGFGVNFTYIHTGLTGHEINGTTLSISKGGSNLISILNSCIDKYILTESYYQDCLDYNLTFSCFKNSYFPSANTTTPDYFHTTDMQSGPCTSGYCACGGV